jgi:hypothetical protein
MPCDVYTSFWKAHVWGVKPGGTALDPDEEASPDELLAEGLLPPPPLFPPPPLPDGT